MRRSGLEVAWFSAWVDELDDALTDLPETPVRPHQLYRELAASGSVGRRKTALVTDAGSPVAVVALRSRWTSLTWKPVTGWIVPGEPFPIRDGYLGPVLDSLQTSLAIPWWRIESPPPAGRLPRSFGAEPRYTLTLGPDYEDYWRQSSLWKDLRRSRRRCEGLEFVVNHPLGLDWTLANWERRFRPRPDLPMPDVAEHLLVARFLQARGRYFSFSLLDDGWPVAGKTGLVHGDDLVSDHPYRDPSYDNRGVGTRLSDLVFEWAFEQGFKSLDLGAGHDYKRRWAPPAGQDGELIVAPRALHMVQAAGRRIRSVG